MPKKKQNFGLAYSEARDSLYTVGGYCKQNAAIEDEVTKYSIHPSRQVDEIDLVSSLSAEQLRLRVQAGVALQPGWPWELVERGPTWNQRGSRIELSEVARSPSTSRTDFRLIGGRASECKPSKDDSCSSGRSLNESGTFVLEEQEAEAEEDDLDASLSLFKRGKSINYTSLLDVASRVYSGEVYAFPMNIYSEVWSFSVADAKWNRFDV